MDWNFNESNPRKWFKIVNRSTGEAHIFDLDEVKGSSKAKGKITIFLKDSGTILIRGRGRWFEDAWKKLSAYTIGVPLYWTNPHSYWAKRKTK